MDESTHNHADAAPEQATQSITSSASGTGIRTGAQYLEGLRDDREVWTEGKRIADVTREPSMMRGAQTLASFLDRQDEDTYRDTVTYLDDDGDRCATAYMIP